MSLREHLRELRPHVEWWAIEKLREKLGEWIAESVVIAIILTIAQKVRGIPFDWWVLGTLFVVSFGFLVYSHRREPRRSDRLSLPVEGSQSQVDIPPLQASSQDAASRKQIAFLFEDYAKPNHAVAQRVTNRLWDRIRNSECEKDWALAHFSKEYGFKPCNLASAALNFELIGPDKENVKLLQQRLREFFFAYQVLVQWTNRLAPLFYPLKEDPEYNAWQEKHNLFYNELKKLTRADDLSVLRRELQHGRWHDIIG